MNRQALGRRAEWAALLLLVLKGYRIRDRNWRAAGGELDLVAERRGEIVFVEVKMRSSADFGGAAAAVDRAKREVMVRVSSAYLSSHDLWDRPSRFDVVAVERRPHPPYWRIRHHRNAFSPDRGRLL
jgi:putative endonuclease